MPIYAIFVQKISGGILAASGAVAVFFIVMGIAEILIWKRGWSHEHRIYLMVVGWFVWLIGILTYLFIASVPMLFLAQILTALGNAIADPAFDAELSEKTDKGIQEYEWGIFEASKDILQGIAAIIGGIVVAFFGFRMLIIFMALAATVSFSIILTTYASTAFRRKED
jgi:hypothetical protein